MVANEEELRQLKIKTGSLTRLTKELVLYEKEHKQEQARVAAIKAANADAHDIKHAVRSPAAQPSAICRSICAPYARRNDNGLQENVLVEANMMIPDTRSRVEAALQDLSTHTVRRPELSQRNLR